MVSYQMVSYQMVSYQMVSYVIRWYQNLNLGETTVHRQDLFFWEHLAPGIKYE
jgi:hypothetical protein